MTRQACCGDKSYLVMVAPIQFLGYQIVRALCRFDINFVQAVAHMWRQWVTDDSGLNQFIKAAYGDRIRWHCLSAALVATATRRDLNLDGASPWSPERRGSRPLVLLRLSYSRPSHPSKVFWSHLKYNCRSPCKPLGAIIEVLASWRRSSWQ